VPTLSEEGLATRAQSVVLTGGRARRRPLAERLEEAQAAASAATGVLMLVIVLQLLAQVPEFYLFFARVREVLLLPPEEVLRRYPQLYWLTYNLSLLLALAHTSLQLAASAVLRPRVVLVLRGPLFYANAVLCALAYFFLVLAAAVTKQPTFFLLSALYAAFLLSLTDRRARRLLERAAAAVEGG